MGSHVSALIKDMPYRRKMYILSFFLSVFFFRPSFLPCACFLNIARFIVKIWFSVVSPARTPPHADMEGFLRSSFLLRLVSLFPLLPSRITGLGGGGGVGE